METECYVCDGFGTWADGQKCPNCGGSGRDWKTEKIYHALEFIKKIEEDIKLTDFQKEFMEKWLYFAWERGWRVGSPEEWAQEFEPSHVHNYHPIGGLYDIYPSIEEFEKELKELTDDLDPQDLERCKKESREQLIQMDSGEVVFIDPEGLFSFTQEY